MSNRTREIPLEPDPFQLPRVAAMPQRGHQDQCRLLQVGIGAYFVSQCFPAHVGQVCVQQGGIKGSFIASSIAQHLNAGIPVRGGVDEATPGLEQPGGYRAGGFVPVDDQDLVASE